MAGVSKLGLVGRMWAMKGESVACKHVSVLNAMRPMKGKTCGPPSCKCELQIKDFKIYTINSWFQSEKKNAW